MSLELVETLGESVVLVSEDGTRHEVSQIQLLEWFSATDLGKHLSDRIDSIHPGPPLTEAEEKLIEARLAELFRTPGWQERSTFQVDTSKFVWRLGWPQKRLLDVRGYLEHPSAKTRLSSLLGCSVTRVIVTRRELRLVYKVP